MQKLLITGASGFVGSAFIRQVLAEREDFSLVGLVRNSDQRNLLRLTTADVVKKALETGRLRLVYGDLCGDISGICEGIDVVINFGAKTFVDRSVKSPVQFIQSNVVGTGNLLEEARKDKVKRYIQISTDEVYGATPTSVDRYREDSRINPTNPYSASKAGGDALAICYAHTFGLHTTITRCENIFGPFQGAEKVFPTFVRKALNGEFLPVYGDGQHVRQWIWVEDKVRALLLLLSKDYEPAQIFHIAGNQELKNIELAEKILKALSRVSSNGFVLGDWKEHIQFIDESSLRPGHDRRYALECEKLKALGWEVQVPLDEGIEKAVTWYSQNKWWWF